jgi:hypothetical protein
MLKSWIDEGYRAQAPKKLAASYAGGAGSLRSKKTARPQRDKRDGGEKLDASVQRGPIGDQC